MTIDIESEFSGLDEYYPGSRRKRREKTVQTEESLGGWDAQPLIKMHNGQPREFFTVGALAQALGKSTVTIRLWERKAYIPKSPYRLPGHMRAGGPMPGKRVFTRALIEAAVEEFGKRGLLGSARVEWKMHDDLTIALVERWTAITTTA